MVPDVEDEHTILKLFLLPSLVSYIRMSGMKESCIERELSLTDASKLFVIEYFLSSHTSEYN